MTTAFLSSSWFDTARELIDGITIASDARARIQFDSGDNRFFLVVERGTVTAFDQGNIDAPDVELRCDPDDALRLWERELVDDEAMRAVTVTAPTVDGVYTGPPAPRDLLGRPELAALPEIPDASIVLEYTLTDAPFGTVHYWLRFDNGLPTADGFGPTDEADVRATIRYRALARSRAGECSVLESIEGGTVTGDVGPLALIDGLLEAPEFHAAEVATGRHAFALATLGELHATPEWIAALDRLARETTLT